MKDSLTKKDLIDSGIIDTKGKRGRPKIENPKTESLHIRFTKKDLADLEFYSMKANANKSYLIKKGLEMVYKLIKNGSFE